MNLFLLVAVPLAAFSVHRWLQPRYSAFGDFRSWILGFVLSLGSLVLASFFGRAREFTGDLVSAFVGLTFTDAMLVPGLVIGAWIFTRPKADPWELGLWLTLLFTLAGLRDFVSTRASFDLNELFLVPIDRIFVLLAAPLTVAKALDSATRRERWYWFVATGTIVLSGSLFQVLSFSWWGWTVWVLLAVGIASALWIRLGAVSPENGPLVFFRFIGANRPKRP